MRYSFDSRTTSNITWMIKSRSMKWAG